MFKKANIFDLRQNLIRNGLKITTLFLFVEAIAHWLVSHHMTSGHIRHVPYARGSGGDFTLNGRILYGVLPAVWIFLIFAARAYGIEKRNNALKRIKSDFPTAFDHVKNQRFTEFDQWFQKELPQLKSWEKKRLLDYRNFSQSYLDK